MVAPHVGAWIETALSSPPAASCRSYPVYVRSFKGIGYKVRPRLLNDILSGRKYFC